MKLLSKPKWGRLTLIVLLLSVFGVSLAVIAIFLLSPDTLRAGVAQIQKGMAVAEVDALFGGPGVCIQSGVRPVGGVPPGEKDTVFVMTKQWEGRGALVRADFVDDRVSSWYWTETDPPRITLRRLLALFGL